MDEVDRVDEVDSVVHLVDRVAYFTRVPAGM